MAVNAGSVTLELQLDSKKFKRALDDVGKTTKKQGKDIASSFKQATETAGKSVTKQFSSANTELQKAEAKLKDLQEKAKKWEKDYRASGAKNRVFAKDNSNAELTRSTEEYIKRTREKFDTLIEAEKRHVAEVKASMGEATKEAGEESSNVGKKFAKSAGMIALFKKIGTPALKALNIALKGVGLAMKGTAKLFKASSTVIATAFGVLGKFVRASLLGIGFAIGALALLWKQGMSDLIAQDAETANSVNSLKNALNTLRLALASAFAPIVNIAIPYLVKLINWITSAVTAIGQLISALTGKKTALVAKKQMGGVGKAVGGVGSSAGKANKQAKELQRTLMGFDKINKLDGDKKGAGGGGGGGGGGGAGGAGGLFDTVPVDKGISKFANRLKESWKKADFTWLGALLAEKINKAMASIPWDKIKEGAWRIAHSIGTFINGFVENFDWGLLGKTISQAILTMFKFVTTFLETVNWQNIGKAIVDLITGIQWGKLFKGASRIVGNIAGALAGLFVGAVKEAGKKLKTELFGTGKLTVSGFFKGILKAIKGIGKWIKNNLFKPFIKGFKKAFGISSPSKVMKEQGGYLIDGLLAGLKGKLKSLLNWCAELPSKIKEKIGSITVNIISSAEDIAGDLKDKAIDMVANFTSWVKGSSFASTISGMVSKFTDWVKGFNVGTITGWVAKFTSWLKDFAVGTVSGWVAKFTSWLSGITPGTISGFTAKLTHWTDALKNKVISFTAKLTGSAGKAAKKQKKKKRKAEGGVWSNGRWHPIQSYATGGEPNEGQLFYAREAGPELVGQIGGHTAVMNNDQIVASVSAGVAKAMAGIRFNVQNATPPVKATSQPAVKPQTEDSIARLANDNREVISLLKQLLSAINGKDTNVYLDGREITNNTIRRINQQTRTTGQFPLIV